MGFVQVVNYYHYYYCIYSILALKSHIRVLLLIKYTAYY